MVVVGVSTDPKPDSDVCIQNGKRAISEPHACCVDWLSRMDLLEAKARVARVALEAAIGFTSAAANMFGKPPVRLAELLSLNNAICLCEQRRGNSEPARFRRLAIDRQFELSGLLDRQ